MVDNPPPSGHCTSTAAQVLSDIFAPAHSVFLICVVAGVTGQVSPLRGLLWGLLLGCFCAVVPMIVIHVAVRREHLSDRHVTHREQRWWVFLICAGSVLCAIATTLVFDGPGLLMWILLTMVAGLVLVGVVTAIGPKVSMHAFCFTTLATIAALLASPWWLLIFALGFPLVAFARLRLRHHTPVELGLGVGLALMVTLSARAFMPDVT